MTAIRRFLTWLTAPCVHEDAVPVNGAYDVMDEIA